MRKFGFGGMLRTDHEPPYLEKGRCSKNLNGKSSDDSILLFRERSRKRNTTQLVRGRADRRKDCSYRGSVEAPKFDSAKGRSWGSWGKRERHLTTHMRNASPLMTSGGRLRILLDKHANKPWKKEGGLKKPCRGTPTSQPGIKIIVRMGAMCTSQKETGAAQNKEHIGALKARRVSPIKGDRFEKRSLRLKKGEKGRWEFE